MIPVAQPFTRAAPSEFATLDDLERAAADAFGMPLDGAERTVSAPVWRPAYETTGPYTLGGPTGSYAISSPYDGPCEYRIVTWAANDGATAAIGTVDPGRAPTATGTYDPTGSMGRDLVPFVCAAAGNTPGPDAWLPLPTNSLLTLNCTVVNSKSLWCCIQFRRRVNAYGIPAFSEE